jgi:hypothetical protein
LKAVLSKVLQKWRTPGSVANKPDIRCMTIEIIVEESGWSPPEKPEIVGLRVEFHETELQRRVKSALAGV